MDHIEELRRERAGINQKVQVLAAVETGGGTLTAEQLTEFASLQQQFTDAGLHYSAECEENQPDRCCGGDFIHCYRRERPLQH
ncbi:hypothetical protein OGV37_01450 [Citrobacter sp. Cb010]|nr:MULTISPECIES: hypothetical protein [unclassified Citrobacter]MDM3373556.1 hypothetical protein [Citrobacter sp. Cb010]MDM3458166.1 hypothetical protein [Citrobacter sp. Cb036]